MPGERHPRTLKPHWFHILLALADRERHGSGIVRSVLEQTGGTLRLWPVMLCRSLEQMVDAHLIEPLSGDEHPKGESGRRRFYRITRSGRRALGEETERLARIAGLARARLADRRTATK